jgi:hypothetical protein
VEVAIYCHSNLLEIKEMELQKYHKVSNKLAMGNSATKSYSSNLWPALESIDEDG